MRYAAALRAFHHRNFRLFFAGQGISIIGTWVQSIALSWLMSRPAVVAPIASATSVAQLEEIMASTRITLDDNARRALDAASAAA